MSDVKNEVERVFPKDKFRLKVYQLDPVGISIVVDDSADIYAYPGSLVRAARDAKRRHARYLTYVMVRDRETNTFVTCASATCSKHDQPRRKLGWQKAMGRAIHNYLNTEQSKVV